jgi:calcineurin-like phosphoesterase family protein
VFCGRVTVVSPIRGLGLAACLLGLTPLSAPPGAQDSVVFGVIGDSGEVTRGLVAVAREMGVYRRDRSKFDFVLMLGDNIYSDGVGRGLAKGFEAPFADLLAANVQFYAVLGNHEDNERAALERKKTDAGV